MELDLWKSLLPDIGKSVPFLLLLWYYLHEFKYQLGKKVDELCEHLEDIKLKLASDQTPTKLEHHKEQIKDLRRDVEEMQILITEYRDEVVHYGRN